MLWRSSRIKGLERKIQHVIRRIGGPLGLDKTPLFRYIEITTGYDGFKDGIIRYHLCHRFVAVERVELTRGAHPICFRNRPVYQFRHTAVFGLWIDAETVALTSGLGLTFLLHLHNLIMTFLPLIPSESLVTLKVCT